MNLKNWNKMVAILWVLGISVIALMRIAALIFPDQVEVGSGSIYPPEIFQAEVCKKNDSNGEISYDIEAITPNEFTQIGICFETEEEDDGPIIVYWYYESQTSAMLKSERHFFSPGELIFVSMYDSAQVPENVLDNDVFDFEEFMSSGFLLPGDYSARVTYGRNNLATLTFTVNP